MSAKRSKYTYFAEKLPYVRSSFTISAYNVFNNQQLTTQFDFSRDIKERIFVTKIYETGYFKPV